jgi:hypothetical protein
MVDNHKDVEDTKGCRHRHTEVVGHDGLGMIAQKAIFCCESRTGSQAVIRRREKVVRRAAVGGLIEGVPSCDVEAVAPARGELASFLNGVTGKQTSFCLPSPDVHPR